MVDLKASKKKLENSGRSVAGWARTKSIDPERMRKIFRGKVQIADKEIAALEADGLLVEKK